MNNGSQLPGHSQKMSETRKITVDDFAKDTDMSVAAMLADANADIKTAIEECHNAGDEIISILLRLEKSVSPEGAECRNIALLFQRRPKGSPQLTGNLVKSMLIRLPKTKA